MNLNKLFPHLSIRAKLGIAFAALAVIPLGLVAGITTRVTVRRLQGTASAAVRQEVELARSEVERTMQRMGRDVSLLGEAFLADLVTEGTRLSAGQHQAMNQFLRRAPFLIRLKVIDGQDVVVYEVGTGSGAPGGSGYYYAWRARRMGPGQTLFLPVEVRGPMVKGNVTSLPAVAVLLPLHADDGAFLGAIVGEARASEVFAGLEQVAPALPGVITVLLDGDGRFLYHSERKRDWASLLEEPLGEELFSGDAQSLDSADVQFRTRTHLVSAGLIHLGAAGGPLRLVRAVPLRTVNAPVREFLGWVVLTGLAVLTLVMGVATVAARQLTHPIYQIREAASCLASGGEVSDLQVLTNDELEGLARDFRRMAEILASQRRQLEEALSSQTRQLARTHAELAQVMDHSADAIVGLDADGRIRVWNRGAEKLFGYTVEEAVGQEADTLLLAPGREVRWERDYLRREIDRNGAVVNFRTDRKVKSGGVIPVSLTQTAILDDSGSAIGTSIILRDVSLQATLEHQMLRSERLATMSMLAAGLAHEINNPIAIIGNRLEAMALELEVNREVDLQQDIAELRNHTTRVADLIATLLRFARAPDETPDRVQLRSIARHVAGLLEHLLAGRSVRLTVSGQEGTTVLCTEPSLVTVCMNLVLNAADAMPTGGTVTIEVSREGAWGRLAVTDEGTGVPEELRERIFEPFFTTKGPQRGTGLGLPLCRATVERYRGRIWVESPETRGSRFVVELPAIEEEIA